jgi:hypothetical protein
LIVLTFQGPVIAGVDYGHGGDVLYCQPSQLNELSGPYALDYVVASRHHDGAHSWLDPGRDYRSSIQRIESLLASKYPELGASLSSFMRLHLNFERTSEPRIWRRLLSFRPMPINDENLNVGDVPENCLDRDGRPNLVQIIIRHQLPGRIIYDFAWMMMGTMMQNQDPVQQAQASFLYVHEWLWDIVDRSDKIRAINALLHSEELDRLTSAQLKQRLKALGVPDILPDPFFVPESKLLIGRYHAIEGGLPYYVVPVYRGEVLHRLDLYDIKWNDEGSSTVCYYESSERNMTFERNTVTGRVEGRVGVLESTSTTAFAMKWSNGQKTDFVVFADFPAPTLEPCGN